MTSPTLRAPAELRWYLWDGGFLVLGRVEPVVPPHAHHAIQLVIMLDGDAVVRDADGRSQSGHGVIVRQDAVHAFNARGAAGALLFVDPESLEGRWISSVLTDRITTVPAARLESCVAVLREFFERPFEGMELKALIRLCVHTFCPGPPPARRLDARVTAVLAAIRDSDELRLSLDAAAALAFLSPSHFSHLFKQQVGLPFRRYVLWRKLTRAMLAMGQERTLAAAAHAADFADAAHLTRTFSNMFGLPPSVLMRGDLFPIANPFNPEA